MTQASEVNVKREGCAMLFGLRLLSEDEQRIAYAILEGMRLQKNLDAQRKPMEKPNRPSA